MTIKIDYEISVLLGSKTVKDNSMIWKNISMKKAVEYVKAIELQAANNNVYVSFTQIEILGKVPKYIEIIENTMEHTAKMDEAIGCGEEGLMDLDEELQSNGYYWEVINNNKTFYIAAEEYI